MATHKETVTIILVTYNRAAYVKKCLSSFFENTDYADFKMIIWDNASTDETRDVINEFKDARICTHFNEANVFQSAFGMALKQIPPSKETKYILELDDDIIAFPKGWLTRMVDACEVVPSLGYLSVNYVTREGGPDWVSGRSFIFKDYANNVRIGFGATGGWCSMTPLSVYNAVGGFFITDAKAFFCEDAEYRKKVAAQGYLYGVLPDVIVHHATGEEAHEREGLGGMFREKYKGNPDKEDRYYKEQLTSEAIAGMSLDELKEVVVKKLQPVLVSLSLFDEDRAYIAALFKNGLIEEPLLIMPGFISKGGHIAQVLFAIISIHIRLQIGNTHAFVRATESIKRLLVVLNTMETITQNANEQAPLLIQESTLEIGAIIKDICDALVE